MLEQADLFSASVQGAISVQSGWYLVPSKESTAESQIMIFDVPGLHSNYYQGQKSEWIVNAIDRIAFYKCGDPERVPSKAEIELASDILVSLTEAGALFPQALEKVIYMNAWEKGADAGFRGEPKEANIYEACTPQFEAWIDGWESN